MKYLFLAFSMNLVFFASCNKEVTTPKVTPISVENSPSKFSVNITSVNYNEDQKEKLDKAAKIISDIFNSEEFKKEILVREFTNSLGLTNLQIYEKLMEGKEALAPETVGSMDIVVTMYNAPLSKVVGYTYPDSQTIYTNSKFHNKYTPCRVASNLTHEWIHKLGFNHSSTKDSKSVPYSLNEIVEKLCPK